MIAEFKRTISFFILSFALFNIANAESTVLGCDMEMYDEQSSAGALVRIYPYDDTNADNYKDINYLSSGYLSHQSEMGATSVRDLSWDAGPEGDIAPYGISGMSDYFPSHHFVMEISGYYRVTQSGIYEVAMNVEGSASLFMGSGLAFSCCQGMRPFESLTNPVATKGVGNLDVTTGLHFYAGVYYPFVLIYVKHDIQGSLDLKITLPDDSVDDTVGNNLIFYGLDRSTPCDALDGGPSFTKDLTTSTTATLHSTSMMTISSTLLTSDSLTDISTHASLTSDIDSSTASISDASALTTETTTITTATTNTNTDSSSSSAVNSDTSISTTEETTFTVITTSTDTSNPFAETSTVMETSSSRGIITMSTTITTGVTNTDSTDTIFSTGTDSIVTDTTTVATGPDSVVTTVATGTDSSITTETTGTDSNTSPESTSVIETTLIETITGKLLTSTSSSIASYYSNSTLHQASSLVTSHEVPSHSTSLKSTSVTHTPDASSDTTYVSSSNTAGSPDKSQTGSGVKPTAPTGNDGSSSTGSGVSTENDRSSNNSSNDNDGSSDNDASEAKNGSSNNNDSSNNNGSSNDDHSSNNGNGKPRSSSEVSAEPSLSVHEGAGALNKEWSLTSLLAIIALMAV